MNINLVLGLVWLVFFFVGILSDEGPNWIDYGWLVVSAIYLALYFYQRRYKYLNLENGILKVNWPYGKKIGLKEVKQIKKFAGEYILKTDKTELKIHTQSIAPDSLAKLNAELQKLDVEWN